MNSQQIAVGFTFNHPTQGRCRVTGTFTRRDGVRYTYGSPGWPARHAVTTRTAIGNLIDAGVLTVD